jgi:hypothetical protein
MLEIVMFLSFFSPFETGSNQITSAVVTALLNYTPVKKIKSSVMQSVLSSFKTKLST